MTSRLRQDGRRAWLDTPLGKDVLSLVRFDVVEHLSQLFEITIKALSEDPSLSFDAAMGRNCCVSIALPDGGVRRFNGVLTEASYVADEDAAYSYRLVLRPWLWLLGHRSDCRIFQNETVPDIINKVFDEAGFSDCTRKLSGDYPTLEYCVQYRETDLTFVSRLMEKFGIYYFHKHDQSRHTLILADSSSAHETVAGGSLRFLGTQIGRSPITERLDVWRPTRSVRTGKVTYKDYDFTKPNAKLLVEETASSGFEPSTLERFDFPGAYTETDLGEKFAKIALEADQAGDQRRTAEGQSPSLMPGGAFSLQDHPQGAENQRYLVVRAVHHYGDQTYLANGPADTGTYRGAFELQPDERPFRAPLQTAKPFVQGPQTAKVVCKSGEEIDVDEHGRITVQFHWDRKAKPSCRVRVAQTWSGKGWGHVIIPRKDQEVVVIFIEGDPDRPMVVGTVYNGDNRTPFDLPSEKTKSGMKSNSSKGGGGYNTLVFDDQKSSEKVSFRAEKDLDVLVRNAESKEVGEDFKVPTGMPSRETKLKMGDDKLSIESGSQKIDIALMSDTEAGLQITLTCGMSKITMNPAMISLEAPMIKLDAMGMVSINGTLVKIN
jgi:type VI secretion system secreted protein VgrG